VALSLAKRAFEWLDSHAHDSVHGGYYEALTQSGQPILSPIDNMPADEIGTRYGDKSMNTHIHLLEALTNLYSVWPDPTVHARLKELLSIVRDRVAQPDGYLAMFFKPDWTVDSTTDSYGHDMETAYLLVEAASALGQPDDGRTWNVAKRLVDHALHYGYDTESGGVFDEGQVGEPCPPTHKVWWEQAEGLNALLLLQEHYGADNSEYWTPFLKQWLFIKNHQIDAQAGGWYPEVEADGSEIPGLNKSDAWTDPYHQGRALMNVSRRLEHMSRVS
jgi:mannobiose 2-epimerase